MTVDARFVKLDGMTDLGSDGAVNERTAAPVVSDGNANEACVFEATLVPGCA